MKWIAQAKINPVIALKNKGIDDSSIVLIEP